MIKHLCKKIEIIAFISVLALGISVTFVAPSSVSATVYEDCDQDGYDDYTGKALPWIFFDGTKGDEIPSDWDWDPAHTATSESAYYASRESKSDDSSSNSSGTLGSSSESSSSPETSSSSNSERSSDSNASNSSSQNKSTNSSSKKKSTSTSKKNKSESTKTSDTKNEIVEETIINEEETTINEEETTLNEKTKNIKSKKKDKKSNKIDNENITVSKAEVSTSNPETNLTIGTIEVYEKDGSALHAGSEIVIKGDNFTAGLEGLSIEIHSNNKYEVGTYTIAEDGSFLVEYLLPEEIEEGEHEVVLTYNGENILVEKVQIGGKAIASFKDTLLVGFTLKNKELIPGIVLLSALFILGVGAVFVSTVGEKLKNN